MRRVGKTTILYQIIDHLIDEGINPRNILYATFDNPILKLVNAENVLSIYETMYPIEGTRYILFDEVQYTENWELWMKVIYDSRKDIRLIATGSASPVLEKGSADSGTGRWSVLKIPTMSFYEYCRLLDLDLPLLPDDLRLSELKHMSPTQLGDLMDQFTPLQNHFNRPDFQRMLGLVEEGMVAVICVKDLSRLGRDYLQTGYYTEVVFPENHTRFIAINDNVDSEKDDNEFAPFKNIINEWYAKDCSRKVRSAFWTKALSGEYTGGYPAYGYQKDPNDRHHLIPDEHAPIVQQMFRMALEGVSCFHIAKALEAERIPTPRAYLMNEFGKYIANERVKHPYAWVKGTVYRILSNPIYLGNLVSQRYQTKSFKDKLKWSRVISVYSGVLRGGRRANRYRKHNRKKKCV